jgi:fructose-1,6-bisphosphatase/inositol monophosphatase family enzyme
MTGSPVFDSSTLRAIDAIHPASEKLCQMIDANHALEVQVKPDNTLVMNIDLALQHEISKVLANEVIVSEELPETHHLIGGQKEYFVIDPLDGTTSCKRFFTSRDTQVGFGPMIGVVKNGSVHAVAFFNAPQRALFVAERGKGAWIKKHGSQFLKLSPSIPKQLVECGLLFYAGLNGELPFIENIRRKDLVENLYRFGGFANDCSRLAQGFEQVQVQFTVKAWDLPAALLIEEAGLMVKVKDASLGWVRLSDWKVAEVNPVLAAPREFFDQLI